MTAFALRTPKTEGLTPLDRERSASIADEGGASAAAVETQEPRPIGLAENIDLDETLPIAKRARRSRARR